MTKYTEKDAASDCNDSVKNVNAAWHQARNDAAGTQGVPADRHNKGDNNSGSSNKSTKSDDSGDSGK